LPVYAELQASDSPIHPNLVCTSPIPVPLVALHISIIGAHMFHMLLKKPGTQSFKMWSAEPEVKSYSVKTADGMPYDPLKEVPKGYHDFTDVFSKQKAQVLSEHQPYDLKIDLKDGAIPPSSSHLYSQAGDTPDIYSRKSELWIYSSVKVWSWCSCPLRSEEGWIAVLML
jgi:hypothetical protein